MNINVEAGLHRLVEAHGMRSEILSGFRRLRSDLDLNVVLGAGGVLTADTALQAAV
jgi:hypothetical protein